MKKSILLSLALVAFIAAAAAGATGAFFSDTETSTGNTFTAGDIDLKIDNESYVTNNEGVLVASEENSWAISDLTNQLFFSFDDVKPGDIGEDTISVHAGTNDAYACMAARITATPENTLVDPETDAGDTGPANGNNGELQNHINFVFWNDDGDNVYETGENTITALTGAAGAVFNGAYSAIGTGAIPGNTTRYVAKAWCFGGITPNAVTQDNLGKTGSNGPLARGTGFTCSGVGNQNIAQTDGIVVDVSFQAVQARNNGQFTCSSLPTYTGSSSIVEVEQQDLTVTNDKPGAYAANTWFFYNDSNDTIMSIDQFAGTGGQNHMESIASAVGAKMVLDTTAPQRYNIATYKFKNVPLASITALQYRVYDATSDSDKPYLQFNVDFNGSDTFQRRLVHVPAVLPVGSWTTVDAYQGGAAVWTYSGATWPAGIGEPGTTPGTTGKTWSQILATYPGVKTRTTDSFFGVRVGQPGPTGATGFVDWIKVNGETNDFVL